MGSAAKFGKNLLPFRRIALHSSASTLKMEAVRALRQRKISTTLQAILFSPSFYAFQRKRENFQPLLKASKIIKKNHFTNKTVKKVFKMFTQRPQVLNLFRRYQKVGATEAYKNFEVKKETFRILNHPSSCKSRSFV